MKDLVYKELRLSINKFFYVLPILLSALFFIPQWFFTLIFMYVFWIAIPQIYSAYIAQQDTNFVSMLPVTKSAVVQSKVIALMVIEMIHVVVGIVFAVIHNMLYTSYNFSLDPNIAFFGVVMFMYGIFNIAFLPYYFKTGYYFGKPTILGTVVTLLYAFVIEYSVIRFERVRLMFEGNTTSQFLILGVGVVGFILLTYLATMISKKRFEQIK